MVATLRNPEISESSVLLAMRKVPPMLVSWGKDMFVKSLQLTKERELPTEVKLGADILGMMESKKPKLLETFWRALKLMEAMFRKDAFWTVRSSGRLICRLGELAAILRAPLTSFKLG